MIVLLLGGLSIVLCFLFLTRASWLDAKTGSVPNKLWLTACIGGCVLSFCKFMMNDPTRVVVTTVFSAAVGFLISLILFKTRLFGGADAKALTTLSIFIPTVIPFFRVSPFPLLTSLSTTINFFLLLVLVFIINFVRNLFGYSLGGMYFRSAHISSLRKIVLLFAYRRASPLTQDSVGALRPYSDPSDMIVPLVIVDSARRSDRQIPNVESDNVPSGTHIAEVWAPLRIPVVLLITLSLIASLLVGDLLILIM